MSTAVRRSFQIVSRNKVAIGRHLWSKKYFIGTSASLAFIGASTRPSFLKRPIAVCDAARETQGCVADNDDPVAVINASLFVQKSYSSIVLEKIASLVNYFWTVLHVSLRGAEIYLKFSPMVVLVPLSYIEQKLRYGEDDTSGLLEDLSWRYFLYSLQSLGPAFVKLGQWAATRRDLFDPYFCDRLSSLHSSAAIHSWKHTDRILRKEFGDNYGDRLVVYADDILGSGSAAQVYRGTYDGKEVAIKVLHPGITSAIERDLMLMKRVAFLIDSLPSETLSCLGLPEVASNFEDILRRQIDLRVEAQNLQRFAQNFQHFERSNFIVTFPRPVDNFVSEHVLVEDFIDGVPISDFLSDESINGLELRKKLAKPLLNAFLKMVFTDNFIHCDLHPGNVLVKVDHLDTSISKISLLDAGLTESLSSQDQQNLRDLFKAVVLNKGNEAGRLMVERAKNERCTDTEGGLEAFSSGIDSIVKEFHMNRKKGLTLGAVRIGTLLASVLDLCRVHGVEIDPAMASVVVSTLVLEGLGRSLEPNLNLFDFVIPLLINS